MAETNQTQKYTDEQKIALEKQLIKEGKILPRTRYAPKGYVGRILAVLLAFLFGIFVTIGGILGAGFYAGTRPLKDVFGMLNFDYSQWLTDTAADMSVLQLTQQLTGGGIDSLGALSAYTPYVDTLLGQIGTQLQELGVTLDNEELKATSFSEIGKYLSDTIQSVELGKVLKVTAQSDPLMLALCYGTEGTNEEGGDYTVNDADEIVMNEGKEPTRISTLVDDASGIIGKVTIEAALSVNADSNATVRYLAYGVEGEDYRIVEGEDGSHVIEMLTDPITGEKHRKKLLNDLTGSTDIVGNATISDLVTIDENSSSLLQTIRDWTVSDLSNSARIDRLKISQLLEVNESSSAILQVMADWRISDLKDQKKIDSLLLGDIVTIKSDSPAIMKSLANTRLDQLGQATDELRLTDILGEQAVSDSKLLRHLGSSTLSTLSRDVNALTVGQIYGDEIYSYLDLGTDGTGRTYADYILNYDPTIDPNTSEAENAKRPEAFDLTGWTLNTSLALADGTQVLSGWFLSDGTLADAKDVHRTLEDNFISNFIRKDIPISASKYVWNTVDYDNNAALVPVADNAISTDTTGFTIETNGTGGTPVTDDNGMPLYYLTERTLPSQDGEPVVQQIAYPVMMDESGYFVRIRTLEDGAQFSTVSRIDLERTVTAYVYANSTAVTLDEDGNAVYKDQVLPILTRTDENEETVYYLHARENVEQKYYTEGENGIVFCDAEDVKTIYTASRDQGGVLETRILDRYLSGTWYLLFGGEEITEDTDGNRTIVVYDNTDAAILEIAPTLTAVTDTFNEKTLGELWLHGVLAENPYADLTKFNQPAYSNLNALTVNGVIGFIKAISAM